MDEITKNKVCYKYLYQVKQEVITSEPAVYK